MDVRWITAFIDRPADDFSETIDFWCAVSGSSLSAWRGDDGEFATLLPTDGSDAHLRVQRTRSGMPGSHIDLHVPDVEAGAAESVRRGASVAADHGAYVVLSTPGAMPFCVVAHDGEQQRQAPIAIGDRGTTTLVDQVSVDADPDLFDDEVRFWSGVTGWSPVAARADGFIPLQRSPSMPLRVMLQRRDAPSRATSCHLDLACHDVSAAAAAHVVLGGSVVASRRYWTVMADPSGSAYCLTARRPATGTLPHED